MAPLSHSPNTSKFTRSTWILGNIFRKIRTHMMAFSLDAARRAIKTIRHLATGRPALTSSMVFLTLWRAGLVRGAECLKTPCQLTSSCAGQSRYRGLTDGVDRVEV